MKKIIINDSTLRDGNHAVGHQISLEQIEKYCQQVDNTGIDIIEVGHGNGLGASSLLVGEGKVSDEDMLKIARTNLKNSKLGIHFIPGFGREKDLYSAIKLGVDVFRIASHATEVNITKRYIELIKKENKIAYGTLMMSHVLSKKELLDNCKMLEEYGADAIILMDSAGNFTTIDVAERVSLLSSYFNIPIGFHAHNNLGLAVANSIEAIRNGATIIDGCIKGFGAGAGNTQLEVLIALFNKMNINSSVSFEKILKLVQDSRDLITKAPSIEIGNILSGSFGLFSAFEKHVTKQSIKFKVNEYEIYKELKNRKVVAGQEDIIIEIASNLNKKYKDIA